MLQACYATFNKHFNRKLDISGRVCVCVCVCGNANRPELSRTMQWKSAICVRAHVHARVCMYIHKANVLDKLFYLIFVYLMHNP